MGKGTVKKKKRRHLPQILTDAEIDSLLAAARAAADLAATSTPKKLHAAWRDFVMIQTGLLAGGRVAELCNLEVANIDLDGARLEIRRGKGNKDRNIPIGGKLVRVLREWIGGRKDGFLFPGPHGRRLNPRTFQLRLAKIAAAAGITKNVHPHQMRHFFACTALNVGGNVREVMELLGHADLTTTAMYLHLKSVGGVGVPSGTSTVTNRNHLPSLRRTRSA
jgi:site-specific recombinase XerD